MAKMTFKRNKPYIHISTIGSIHHGKTTLAAAITKVLAMRHQLGEAIPYDIINNPSKEYYKGAGVFVSYIGFETSSREYSLIDCPDHIDYIKNIICNGASSLMDGAILVVSATEGVVNQTREHIQLVSQIKTPQIVAFINKCDDTLSCNEEILENIVEMEIREILDEYGFSGKDTPIIRGSALQALETPDGKWGDKILELLEAVDTFIKPPIRHIERPFLMPIEVVDYMNGQGTFAAGRVNQGILNIQDKVEIVGLTHKKRIVTVADIVMYGKSLNLAYPGDTPALLLRGVQASEIKQGQVLSKPDSIASYDRFTAIVYLLSKDEGGFDKAFYNKCQLQFYFNIVGITGVITLPDYHCMSGNHAEVAIELDSPVAMDSGSCFTIRVNEQRVGVGFVVDIPHTTYKK